MYFFNLFIIFYCFVANCFAIDLRQFDIDIIFPACGATKQLQCEISELIGKKIHLPAGGSLYQVFADENVKFEKLDKSLRSSHKILWAVRGGYGVDKIMPLVVKSDYSKETKKIIIGYSDLTPLMVYFAQKYGWMAINAPMLKDFVLGNKSKQSYEAIVDFLKNKIKLSISDLKPLNNFSKNKEISGKVIGGNITCIVSTIGTKWQIQTKNRILFLEDVNVFGYQLDRLLTHMKNAGIFDNVKAIIFGNFGVDDNKVGVNQILKKFASTLNIPVYKSNKFGHQKDNFPIVLEADGIIKSHTFVQFVK